jgi:hypothetical protein
MDYFCHIRAGVALAALVLLISCDPQTCGTAYIANAASDTVVLERRGGNPVLLAPEQVHQLGPDCGLARGSSPENMIFGAGPLSKSGVTCKKDVEDSRNWTTTQTAKYEFVHHFEVKDSDF